MKREKSSVSVLTPVVIGVAVAVAVLATATSALSAEGNQGQADAQARSTKVQVPAQAKGSVLTGDKQCVTVASAITIVWRDPETGKVSFRALRPDEIEAILQKERPATQALARKR